MGNIILKAENISKQYRLGQLGTGTISHDLNRWWSKLRGKEDPFLKIGDVNDRSQKGNSQYTWALQDINFEVQEGEVLGIIGKNGAGKSTLLKILSRVTAPTTGVIKTRGRIASLLEVGTGFHGEMTGRENIYMNGSILGMTKKEITSKLDEIIDFSGCERYIDTPVKRYSSGMTVRLAFAVAAHLEPEILVVDEVLAVGDAEFQRKAIGKMQDMSREGGRTVLFVSHNMAAVKSLCDRGMLMNNGKLIFQGSINDTLSLYKNEVKDDSLEFIGDKVIKKIQLKSLSGFIEYKSSVQLILNFDSKIIINQLVFGIVIKDLNDDELITINNNHYGNYQLNEKEVYSGNLEMTINNLLLLPGRYKIDVFLGDSSRDIDTIFDAIYFTVSQSPVYPVLNKIDLKMNKVFCENIQWSFYQNHA